MSEVVIPYRFRCKRDTAANFTAANTLLLAGEWGIETDTLKTKVGDGVTAWNSLAYQGIWTLADIRRALDLLGSTAEGDIIYKGASGWTRLPKGIDGQFLKLVSGLPAWGSGGSGGGALVPVGSPVVVSGGAVSAISWTSLDLSNVRQYLIAYSFKNATGSDSNISLYYNSDSTATNYYRHSMGADGGISGARVNSGQVTTIPASGCVTGTGRITADIDGRPRAEVSSNRAAAASIAYAIFAHIRNNTANVTSIQLSASVASSIGNGSWAQLYEVT